MAPEKLEILISADNKKAIAAIKETILSLDGVEKASKGAGGATQKMGKDFTGLSRVIQDMPYGFNAIANNLTNILPAAGAAGLAVSALVAGLQFASLGFDNWTRGLGESKKATEEANKINEDYIAGLAKEKTQLDLLFRTATNANAPLNARIDAVKNLRNEYGAYLKDFSDEEILAGKAGKAYESLSTAIIKAAKARAASALIEAKQLEVLKLEEENTKALANAETQRAAVKGTKTLSLGNISGAQFSQAQVSQAQQYVLISNELNKSLNTNKERIATLKAEMEKLGIEYDVNTVKLDENKTKKEQSTQVTQAEIDAYVKAQKELEYYNNLIVEQTALNRLKANMGRLETGTVDSAGINLPQQRDITNIQLTTTANNTLTKALGEQSMALSMLKLKKDEAFAADTANYLTQSMTGMFNAMINGQSIGTALGDMFKRLAVDIAMAAAKAAIFQGIMSALTMGGSAAFKGGQAVGASLMGGKKGGGFLSLLGKLLGFSEGGTVSGPKSGYPVMLHGTEHIVRPDQMRSIIASASQMGGGNSRVVVEGVVRGNDIWLSQSRTNTFRALTT
jgi:hypothetical protein